MQLLILLIASGYVQRCRIAGALFLLEHERTVRCAEQTVGAGDHVELIVSLLFAGMMHQQQTDAALIGEGFQLANDIVVVGVAVAVAAVLSYLLQRINDDQFCIRMIPHKSIQLLL